MKVVWLQLIVLLVLQVAPLRAAELLPTDTPIDVVIDHYVRLKCQQDDIQPARLADNANLIRRTTLDLAGRIPTVAEAKAYIKSSTPQKRTMLVDRLLASPDFAFHHRNELDALLLAGKKEDNEWRKYLLKAARENRPWDQMFREMMIGREDQSDERPALTFLKIRAKNVDDLTVDTSSIFFGVNISCAKCHDHPLVEDWVQDHFYGMASFFSRTYLTKKNTLAEKYSGIVKYKTTMGEEKQAKFMFLTGAVIEEPAIEKTKEQRKAEEKEVKRQLKDAKAPPPKPPAFSPRAKLVEVALESGTDRFFSRAIVNRLWARFMGHGLVHPLDQMHSGNEPSHPELLAWLARDLMANGYDLKPLIRGIVLSDAYARSSRWDGNGKPPAREYFAVAIPRPLSPRQYSLSLLMATSSPDSLPGPAKPDEWPQRREQLENVSDDFAGLMELPGENFQVSVDEALLFSNNERIERDYLRDSNDRLIGTLKGIKERKSIIETAFWAVLSRAPDAEEINALKKFLSKRDQNPVSAVRQIVWALITSPELRFNY